MSEGSLAFNPEFDPDGAEGGVDTNLLPGFRSAVLRAAPSSRCEPVWKAACSV